MEENNSIMEENDKEKEKKKIKNLISFSILLAGLFIGSLFVDVSQIVRGGGYSQKNLSKSDIFEAGGKTWVAYNEPAVTVSVLSDDDCQECDPGEVLMWLRRVLPTISSEKVSYDSEEGKKLIGQFQIKTLPAMIFGKNVESTELYSQAKELFVLTDDRYVLNTQALGVPTGKYLSLPPINEGDAIQGNPDAKVKVVVYSDFQCPYCKAFHSTLRETMKSYLENVVFDFKEVPLSIHPKANDASLAAGCALEQGKFWEYADELYVKQSEWGEAKDTAVFKNYARNLGLETGKFNECLDGKKYQSKIDANLAEANSFGVSGTPTIFINDQVESGALSADQLKKAIDEQLNK